MTRAFEAEESPLLEAVTMERLVKTLPAGKYFGCCDDVWRLAVAQ
jgi:hypothetical protein